MTNKNQIPPILHQTWKDSCLPSELVPYQRTWQELHPGWEYRFWTDEDNRKFLHNHYSWFLPVYDGYSENIKRADAVRYFIMYHFGGAYVDLDFECLRPLHPLLANKIIVLGLEPPEHLDFNFAQEHFDQVLGNAFMASQPRYPFWKHVFEYLTAYQYAPSPLDATGPFLLTRAYQSFKDKGIISIESSNLLYPITSEKSRNGVANDPTARLHIARSAFAIHHWHGTWWHRSA